MTADHQAIAIILFFPVSIFIISLWLHFIQPLFIPKAEIEKLADEYIQEFGEKAYDFAHKDEDRAWRYSRAVEQGKWRRVGKEIRKKQAHLYVWHRRRR